MATLFYLCDLKSFSNGISGVLPLYTRRHARHIEFWTPLVVTPLFLKGLVPANCLSKGLRETVAEWNVPTPHAFLEVNCILVAGEISYVNHEHIFGLLYTLPKRWCILLAGWQFHKPFRGAYLSFSIFVRCCDLCPSTRHYHLQRRTRYWYPWCWLPIGPLPL